MKTLRLLSWITARFIVEQHREIGFVARLALLSLIIGVSVLVIVLSVVNGFQKELETNVLSNLPQAQILIADGLSKQDLARLQNLDDSGVTAIAPFMQRCRLMELIQTATRKSAQFFGIRSKVICWETTGST